MHEMPAQGTQSKRTDCKFYTILGYILDSKTCYVAKPPKSLGERSKEIEGNEKEGGKGKRKGQKEEGRRRLDTTV